MKKLKIVGKFKEGVAGQDPFFPLENGKCGCGMTYEEVCKHECEGGNPAFWHPKYQDPQHSPTPKPDMTKKGIFPWTKEEQSYIVRAVDNHEALIKALRECLQEFREMDHDSGGNFWAEFIDAKEKIIKQAEVSK